MEHIDCGSSRRLFYGSPSQVAGRAPGYSFLRSRSIGRWLALTPLVIAANLASGGSEHAHHESWPADIGREQVAAVENKMRTIGFFPDKGTSRRQLTPQEPLPRLLSPEERRVFDVVFSHGHGAHVLTDEEECDDEAFATKTGADLVKHIRSTPSRCIGRLFSQAASRFAAFSRKNMIDVAEAAKPLAVEYDGTNSSNIGGVLYFLRAGFYVEFNEGDNLDWSEPDADITAAVVAALDAFTDNAHFYDETEAHCAHAMLDAVTLMDSAFQSARYLPVTKSWLERWDPAFADTRGADKVANQFFVLLFRGHWFQDYVDAIAEDRELVRILRDMALDDWMLDTPVEYIAAGAGGELARFSQHDAAPIHADVREAIGSILDRYDMVGEGNTIWIATASLAAYHDDCDAYGICGFEEEMEERVLAIHHECSDTVTIRAQDLEPAGLDKACAVMEHGEMYFHVRLGTRGSPVASDNNSTLEVVVFASSDDYELYSPFIFGNTTGQRGDIPRGASRRAEPTKRGSSPMWPLGSRTDPCGTWRTNRSTTSTVGSTCGARSGTMAYSAIRRSGGWKA